MGRLFRSDRRGVTSLEYGSIILLLALVLGVPMALAASRLYAGFGSIDSSASSSAIRLPVDSDGMIIGSTSYYQAGNAASGRYFYNATRLLYASDGTVVQNVTKYDSSTGVTTTMSVPWVKDQMTTYTDPATGQGIWFGASMPNGGYPAQYCARKPAFCQD